MTDKLERQSPVREYSNTPVLFRSLARSALFRPGNAHAVLYELLKCYIIIIKNDAQERKNAIWLTEHVDILFGKKMANPTSQTAIPVRQ